MTDLADMSLDQLWELFPITLVEYKPSYPEWYEEEKLWLVRHLRHLGLERINHIGSTAVEGLQSKATIDILIEFKHDYDTNDVHGVLDAAGWILMSESGSTHRASYCKGYTPLGLADKSFHLHVRPLNDWPELYFRDYLRDHPEVASDYVALKLKLEERFKHDRDGYTIGKSDFCNQHDAAARLELSNKYDVRPLNKKKVKDALLAKDTTEARTHMDELEELSRTTPAVYQHFEVLLSAIHHDRAATRGRAFKLIALNSLWDADRQIEEHLDEIMDVLFDDTATMVRQCIPYTAYIVRSQPELTESIREKLDEAANYVRTKESMQKLIQQDIESLDLE